jgi:hypothetical protein
MVKKIKHNSQNRILYAFIILGLLIGLGIGVYALAPGVAPNPGHLITQVAPPDPCSTGQFIKWDGSTWVCANGTTVIINNNGTTNVSEFPTAPTNLLGYWTFANVINNDNNGTVFLRWDPSTDNVGVVGYKIYRNGTLIEDIVATDSTRYTTFDGLTDMGIIIHYFTYQYNVPDNSDYVYNVSAYDVDGHESIKTGLYMYVPYYDFIPPTASINFPTQGATVSGVIDISVHATDNVGMNSVNFYADGLYIGAVSTGNNDVYTLSFDTARKMTDGPHWFSVIASDGNSNKFIPTPVDILVNNGYNTDIYYCGDNICQIGETVDSCPNDRCHFGSGGGIYDDFYTAISNDLYSTFYEFYPPEMYNGYYDLNIQKKDKSLVKSDGLTSSLIPPPMNTIGLCERSNCDIRTYESEALGTQIWDTCTCGVCIFSLNAGGGADLSQPMYCSGTFAQS